LLPAPSGLIKNPDKLDLALFAPINLAQRRTVDDNQVKAAPILTSEKPLRAGRPTIVPIPDAPIACTGSQGLRDAEQMCAWTADQLV